MGRNQLYRKIRTPNGYYIYETRSNRLLRVTEKLYELVNPTFIPRVGHQSTDNSWGEESEENRTISAMANEWGLFKPGPIEQRIGPVCENFVTDALFLGAEMLTIEVTDACNLRCKYCVYSGGYKWSRRHGVNFMDKRTASAAIDFYLSTCKREELSVSFYGGEPLLNFDLIRACTVYAEECEKKADRNRPIRYSVTTNATLLHGEILQWLIENKFNITISLDGPSDIHDRHRVFPNGNGTHSIASRNLRKIYDLDPEYYNDHVLVNCVICPCNNLLNLKSFFEDQPELFGEKLQLTEVSPGSPGYFAEHRRYDGYSEDFLSLHKEYLSAHILGRTNTATFNNSFSKCLFERDYLLFHRRPIYDTAENCINQINSCFPGSRKVFIDLKGRVHMCEKINQHFPIGNVWEGYDIRKIKWVFNDFAKTMNTSECRNCWGVRMCSQCFIIGTRGAFPAEFQRSICPKFLDNLEQTITNYCAVVETNPTAFDYMKGIAIA